MVAGQFKNARVFEWLCLLHLKYKVPHLWNYFENGHGKGEHDGAGACIKTTLRREEMKFIGARLRDAASIVQWCASIMGEQATRKHLVRRIFLGGYKCGPITNTSGEHSAWNSIVSFN